MTARAPGFDLAAVEKRLLNQRGVIEVTLAPAAMDASKGTLRVCVRADREQLRAIYGCRAATANRSLLRRWNLVWEQVYREEDGDAPSHAGWRSSYTGEAIPEEEMREWLDRSVAPLRELARGRILEIGCGTGLLVRELAPEAAAYHARDFSPAAIERLTRWCARSPGFGRVHLRCCDAADLADIPAGSIDLVILNSVVQYFPDRQYLAFVLESVAEKLSPDGVIFLGDIRDSRLSRPFHVSVQRRRLPNEATIGALEIAVLRAMRSEAELMVSPADLLNMLQVLPQVSFAVAAMKRGSHRNEMTCFRYDAFAHARGRQPPRARRTLDWQVDLRDVPALEHALADIDEEDLLVRAIPDARIAVEVEAARLLEELPQSTPLGALSEKLNRHAQPADPEAILAAVDALGLSAQAIPSLSAPGHFDLICSRQDELRCTPPPSPEAEAAGRRDMALPSHMRQSFEDDLRAAINPLLPERYAVTFQLCLESP